MSKKIIDLTDFKYNVLQNKTSIKFNITTNKQKKITRKNLAYTFINVKCTENVIWASSMSLGGLILCMQILPIFFRHWIHIVEPKTINQTNDKGDLLEIPFLFNIGYFTVCRKLKKQINESKIDYNKISLYYPNICVWNLIIAKEELIDFSIATNAILVRLNEFAILHAGGTLFTICAFLFSLNGYFKKNSKTLYSALFYCIGGLSVMAGILQMICVVDDEMYPRMKSRASGEPSTYSFSYGISFLAAALSFLPIQLCIYLQTSAFFKRYPNPQEKAMIIPGLQKLYYKKQKLIKNYFDIHLTRNKHIMCDTQLKNVNTSTNNNKSVSFN